MRDNIVSSSYWFLINSNLNVHNPLNTKKMVDFKEGIDRIFLSRNLLNFIRVKDEADSKIDKEKLLSEIRSEAILEIGDKNGLLHCHVSTTIYHRSTIKLETNDIAKFFTKNYGFVVYVSPPRLVSDHSVMIKRYQLKNIKNYPKLRIESVVIDENGEAKNYYKVFK